MTLRPTHFLASLAALIAAFSSSVFSSAAASVVDMKRGATDERLGHDGGLAAAAPLEDVADDEYDGGGTNAEANMEATLPPTARRAPADETKRSMRRVDTMKNLVASLILVWSVVNELSSCALDKRVFVTVTSPK